MEEQGSLACPLGFLGLLSYTIQGPVAGDGTTHSEPGLPTSVVHQENATQAYTHPI